VGELVPPVFVVPFPSPEYMFVVSPFFMYKNRPTKIKDVEE